MEDEVLESLAFEIDWSERFVELAKRTNDFLETLPITQEQMDNLVDYLVQNVKMVSEDSWTQGFGVGAGLKKPKILKKDIQS